MKINGIEITKSGFLHDGTRFHILNEDEIPPFILDEWVKYYPIEKIQEVWEGCKNPFKFIYDFITLKTIVGQGETAIFE
jgi:hypothetical protein